MVAAVADWRPARMTLSHPDVKLRIAADVAMSPPNTLSAGTGLLNLFCM
jgi:hypothetical protein